MELKRKLRKGEKAILLREAYIKNKTISFGKVVDIVGNVYDLSTSISIDVDGETVIIPELLCNLAPYSKIMEELS